MLSLSFSQFKPYFLLSKQIFMALCEWLKPASQPLPITMQNTYILKMYFYNIRVFSLNSKISHINELSLEIVSQACIINKCYNLIMIIDDCV